MQTEWQETVEAKKKQLDSLLKDLGVKVDFEFDRFKEDSGVRFASFNGNITLGRASESLPYFCGLGCLPKDLQPPKNRPFTLWEKEQFNNFLSGFPARFSAYKKKGGADFPESISFFSCLIFDMEALDYSFEDWADNLGYDTDSRKAESIYAECVKNSIKLLSLIGQSAIDKIKEIVQDY